MKYLSEIGNFGMGTRINSMPNQGGGQSFKKRFVPLSAFFLGMDGREVDTEDDRIMGYSDDEDMKASADAREVQKKKTSKKKSKADKGDDERLSDEKSKKKSDVKEGMTTSANIATVPVPIGPGIKSVHDVLDFAGEKKKKKKRRMALLRRLS